MIFPKAKKIASKLDWYKTKNGVFGIYKNYFFNVLDASLLSSPQFKFITVTTDFLTEEQREIIKSELDINKKNLKFTSFEIRERSILFQFAENFTFTKLETVYSLFDFLIDLFKKNNLSEQNKCHNCSSKDDNIYCNINEVGIILCNTCFNEIEKQYIDFNNKLISEQKNYLTGFLGALLFSGIGTFIWILLAVYLNRISSGMAFIIGILSIYGYDYFKGKQGYLKKYLIVLTNIVSIIIANIITTVIMMLNSGLALSQCIFEFQMNDVVKEIFYKNLILSFILVFFVWLWLFFNVKNKNLTILKANKFNN